MLRFILIFVFGAAMAALLSVGLYDAFRSGVLSNRYGTSRRAHEPVQYWIGMCVTAFAAIVLTVMSVLLLVIMLANVFRGL